MLDVVVLPCVPVTAIVGLQARELAEQVGAVQLALRATARSGLSGGIARRVDDLGAVGDVGGVVADGGSIPAARSSRR